MTSRKPLIFLSVCMRERERERENISQSLKETIEHMNQTTPILHMHKLQAQGVCVCVCVSFTFIFKWALYRKNRKAKSFSVIPIRRFRTSPTNTIPSSAKPHFPYSNSPTFFVCRNSKSVKSHYFHTQQAQCRCVYNHLHLNGTH